MSGKKFLFEPYKFFKRAAAVVRFWNNTPLQLWGICQNCTRTRLHENKFARGHKTAQGNKIARRQFCTKGQFFTRVKKTEKKLKDKLIKIQKEKKSY